MTPAAVHFLQALALFGLYAGLYALVEALRDAVDRRVAPVLREPLAFVEERS